eukprot:594681-Prymnesium_polylepis.1
MYGSCFFLPNSRSRHPPYHVDTNTVVRHLNMLREADAEFNSLPGARARQSGRVHPTGRLGGPLNGGTTPQCN